MHPEEEYIEINRKSWNNRVEAHVHSAFYDVPGFIAGKNSLQDIEINLLGDLRGKRVLHLQCHFGQDTLSLARMGAIVTGIDLSDAAISFARNLAEQTGIAARFICCDLYTLPTHLDGTFDVVFTSYGTIGWLPDLDRWAQVIAHYLTPGGTFVFAEFHPVVWMFDDHFRNIQYRYFNSGALIETESGTYADKSAPITQTYVMWNHGLAEVLSPLIRHGLEIQAFQEFDYSPYNCFAHTVEICPGKYRIQHLGDKIPMVYALRAVRSLPFTTTPT